MIRLLLADVRPLEDAALYSRLYSNASPCRRAAADSFRFLKDRMLSLGAAVLLDKGLSGLGLRERDMEYGHNAWGKPFFLNAPGIHFNISHSSTKVAVAISDREVGCDIEEVTGFDQDVAECFFSAEELRTIMSCQDPARRSSAFFRYWTLKESYMKAKGEGMSLPSQSFTVRESGDSYVAVNGGAPDGGFVLLAPDTFDGYSCAICHDAGCGPDAFAPEVCMIGDDD